MCDCYKQVRGTHYTELKGQVTVKVPGNPIAECARKYGNDTPIFAQNCKAHSTP